MEKLLSQQAIEIITKEVKKTKYVAVENNTGTSWFEGKTRLVKVLATKKHMTIEINQKLTADLETELGTDLTPIDYATAHKKHLGTLKYYYKTNSIDKISKIIQNILNNPENSK